jgi:hypothetical protein
MKYLECVGGPLDGEQVPDVGRVMRYPLRQFPAASMFDLEYAPMSSMQPPMGVYEYGVLIKCQDGREVYRIRIYEHESLR